MAEVWTDPPTWTTKRRILHTDINQQGSNLKYLKERPCEDFYIMGQVGNEIIPLEKQQAIHINYIVKRVPPGYKVYIRDASKNFTSGQLTLQLDGFEASASEASMTWYPCPEVGHGSYNKPDPTDITKTSYWRVTRWSSTVNGSEPVGAQGWYYEGFGHLMCENESSTTPALIELRIIIRNLTGEIISISKRDCGLINFHMTPYKTDNFTAQPGSALDFYNVYQQQGLI